MFSPIFTIANLCFIQLQTFWLNTDFSAHKTDPYRLDIVVPNEQHFYLRAGSPHERQNWLVALGSIKSAVNCENALKGYIYKSVIHM